MSTIGDTVRTARLAQGRSLRGLARVCGVHHRHLQEVELGLRRPGPALVWRLARELGISSGLLGDLWIAETVEATRERALRRWRAAHGEAA